MNPSLRRQAATTRFASPIIHKVVEETTREEKIDAIAFHFRKIMEILGLDLTNDSIKRTPERVAAMYVNEVFAGLDLNAFPEIAMFDASPTVEHHGRCVITRVNIVSFCEHHFVPMIGLAYIGYLPRTSVIGLSKISRIAQYFAARPQLQERLTAQIGDSLATLLGHPDVAVLVTARHACVGVRGAKDDNALTTTLHTSGIFSTSSDHRKDFLDLTSQLRKE
jgi:GTP cyclohydrolase I